jgi:hypothetical protein
MFGSSRTSKAAVAAAVVALAAALAPRPGEGELADDAAVRVVRGTPGGE